MEPGDIIKAMAGIECLHGKETCMNALAEVISEILKDLGERGIGS